MKKNEIAAMIDHTQLKAAATAAEIDTLCAEAREYGFASVCVNPVYVTRAARLLKGSDVKVCTVIGFPLGANTPEVKAFEAMNAVRNGAQELDMVINVGAAKDGDWQAVEDDIRAVVSAASGRLVKVILENCYLTPDEIVEACKAAERAGADFVKTSTGFGSGGAKAEDVALMRRSVSGRVSVKAAGGIHSYEEALAMIEAGAARIGASAGKRIVGEAED